MEKIIVFIAEILLAKTFKKYWPVGGSYWNKLSGKPRLNIQSKYELNHVIKDAYYYTQIHVNSLVIEFLICVPCIIFANNVKIETICVYFVLVGIHLYALLIHQYNRILARQKLELIKDEPEQEINNNNNPYELKIFELGNGSWYRIRFDCGTYQYIYLKPYFTSKEKAEKYKEDLEYRVDDIEDAGERALELIRLSK